MRPTWIVLGLVVGLGAVAYVKLRDGGSKGPSPALTKATASDVAGVAQAPAPGKPAPGRPTSPV